MTETRPEPMEKPPQDALDPASPVRKRRKHARPSEIIEAALQIFGQQGFGATKLSDIARMAGVSKATLFVYFSNKEELFRAAVQSVLTSDLDKLRGIAADKSVPLKEAVPQLLLQIANIGKDGLPPIARLIIAESKTFPDLARMWHEEVVAKVFGVLIDAIARAQASGEMLPGNPKLYAFSIIGPMLLSILFRDVFGEIDDSLPDLQKLAQQHAKIFISGAFSPSNN